MHYFRSDEPQSEPLGVQELRELISLGQIDETTLLTSESLEGSIPASMVPGLFSNHATSKTEAETLPDPLGLGEIPSLKAAVSACKSRRSVWFFASILFGLVIPAAAVPIGQKIQEQYFVSRQPVALAHLTRLTQQCLELAGKQDGLLFPPRSAGIQSTDLTDLQLRLLGDHTRPDPSLKVPEETANPQSSVDWFFNSSLGTRPIGPTASPDVARSVLFRSPEPWPDGRYLVATGDGHVGFVKASDFTNDWMLALNKPIR